MIRIAHGDLLRLALLSTGSLPGTGAHFLLGTRSIGRQILVSTRMKRGPIVEGLLSRVRINKKSQSVPKGLLRLFRGSQGFDQPNSVTFRCLFRLLLLAQKSSGRIL